MTDWNVPLQLNNLQALISQQQAIGLTNPLNQDVQGNGKYIAGMSAPPFGTSAIVCAGSDTYLIEDATNNPLLVVSNTGLVLGGATPNFVPVNAPTVTPATDSSTKIATTAFVQSAISATPPPLSSVLTAGNTATNNITLNNTGVGSNTISLLPNFSANNPHIELSDGTTTNVINKNGMTTRNSVQNITHFLNFVDNSTTGVGAIQKTAGITCNPSTNTVSATTFVGALTGTASTATNIAGGAGGSIPYQSSANTTALLANGTAGQVLTSQGTTLAPIWTTVSGGSAYPGNLFGTTTTPGATSVDFWEDGVKYRCWVFPTTGAYTLTFPAGTTIPNGFLDFCLVGGGGSGGNGSATQGGGGGGGGMVVVGYNVPIIASGVTTINITGTVGGAGASSTIVLPISPIFGSSNTTITATAGGNGGNGGSAGGNGTTGFTNALLTPFTTTLQSSGGGGGGNGAGGTSSGTNAFPKTYVSDLMWGGGRSGASSTGTGGAGGGGVNETQTNAINTFGTRGGRGGLVSFDNTIRILGGGGGGGAGTGGGTGGNGSGINGGGGNGGNQAVNGGAGTANTGGGGGGGGFDATTPGTGGTGGSGLVMIRYTIA